MGDSVSDSWVSTPPAHNRHSIGHSSGKVASVLLGKDAGRREAIADKASKMAQEISDLVSRNNIKEELASTKAMLEKEQAEHAVTREGLAREKAEAQEQKAHAHNLQMQMADLRRQIDGLEVLRRSESMLLEEDLLREKELTGDYRERLYLVQRELQAIQSKYWEGERQTELLKQSIEQLQVDAGHIEIQGEKTMREIHATMTSLETAFESIIGHSRLQMNAVERILAFSKGHELSLEGLVHDKEHQVLHLQESFEAYKSSSEQKLHDYEERIENLHADISAIERAHAEERRKALENMDAIQDAHDQNLSELCDIKASSEYFDQQLREKDELIERLKLDLKTALTASRTAELSLQEADAKALEMEKKIDAIQREATQERRYFEEREEEQEIERARQDRLRQEDERERDKERKCNWSISQTLIEELQSELALTKQSYVTLLEQSEGHLVSLEQQAEMKQLAFEKALQERDKEMLKNHSIIADLGARILKLEELLRVEQEKSAKAAEDAADEMKNECDKWKTELMLSTNQSVGSLEGKLQVATERLQEVSLIAREVPHLRKYKQRVSELEYELQVERERATEEEESRSKLIAEYHSLQVIVKKMEERALDASFSICEQEGKNKALVQEVERERETLTEHQAELQKLLRVNQELRAELYAFFHHSQQSVSKAVRLEKDVEALEVIMQEVLTQALKLRDMRDPERALNLRESRLADLLADMERALVRTEATLAEESKARQVAEEELLTWQEMYRNLKTEHAMEKQLVHDLEGKIDVLVHAVAEHWESRVDDKVDGTVCERSALRNCVDGDFQLRAKQNKETAKWRRRADDMQIHANSVALVLEEVETRILQVTRSVDSALERTCALHMQHTALRSSLAKTISQNRSLLDELEVCLQNRDQMEAEAIRLRQENNWLHDKVSLCGHELETLAGGASIHDKAVLLQVTRLSSFLQRPLHPEP